MTTTLVILQLNILCHQQQIVQQLFRGSRSKTRNLPEQLRFIDDLREHGFQNIYSHEAFTGY